MILGISGSPRLQSSDFILNESLDFFKKQGYETEFFSVRGKKIGFCFHCDYCIKNGECIQKDDASELYDSVKKADAFIIVSPVYNGGISAQLKALLDRTRGLLVRNPNMLNGKIGTAIAVGGDKYGGQELAIQQIITFYILNGIIPVSGGAMCCNLGVGFHSKDTLEGVKEDSEGFKALDKNLKKFQLYLDKIIKD